ncbi:MAG: hypothetical protein J6W06_10520 [Bacteroidales bacterium]|nr:hypothetical protein [Bacteroidales bacterium]
MERLNIKSLLFVAMSLVAFAGCEKEQEPEEPAESHHTVVTYSDCKAQKGFNDITTSVRYENGILYFSHTNVEFNCAVNDVSVVPEINGQTINVTINEVLGELVADCNCPRDVNYTIDNIAEGHYNIVVSVRNDTIYQTEMDCHETHNTRVNYSECLSNQRDDSSITSSVRYENGTLYFTHENLDVNCGFAGITVEPEINGQTINVTIIEVEGEPMDCYCLINANYTIDNIKQGTYTIIVKLHGQVIYQGEINC